MGLAPEIAPMDLFGGQKRAGSVSGKAWMKLDIYRHAASSSYNLLPYRGGRAANRRRAQDLSREVAGSAGCSTSVDWRGGRPQRRFDRPRARIDSRGQFAYTFGNA